MSYILDALKKMEQEKNMKAAPKERINLSGALLKDNVRPAGKAKAGKLVGIIVVVLIAAFGVAWHFLYNTPKVAVTAAPQAAVNAVPTTLPQQNQVPVPAPQVPVQSPPVQAVSPAPLAAKPSPASPVTSPPAAAPVAVRDPGVPTQVSLEEEEETARPLRKNRRNRNMAAPPAQVATTSTASVLPTIAAPANIKVTGIAWQDERSARRAVVNDVLMKEGTVVSGARITEIKTDRVKFSLSGSTFEVPLLSSATAAPGAGK